MDRFEPCSDISLELNRVKSLAEIEYVKCVPDLLSRTSGGYFNFVKIGRTVTSHSSHRHDNPDSPKRHSASISPSVHSTSPRGLGRVGGPVR
jgi:hypothetical protein